MFDNFADMVAETHRSNLVVAPNPAIVYFAESNTKDTDLLQTVVEQSRRVAHGHDLVDFYRTAYFEAYNPVEQFVAMKRAQACFLCSELLCHKLQKLSEELQTSERYYDIHSGSYALINQPQFLSRIS